MPLQLPEQRLHELWVPLPKTSTLAKALSNFNALVALWWLVVRTQSFVEYADASRDEPIVRAAAAADS